jgi:glycosyltransferase involved in cell wall biosynthesis
MSAEPRVSVVLTTFNRAHVLRPTLDSILGQTFSDYELIICDNCSTDGTKELCQKYVRADTRVSYYRHQDNIGMPGNLNFGIRKARGVYLANLHDGDLYDRTMLEKWVGALDACSHAAFVFNAYGYLDPSGSPSTKVDRVPLPPCFPGTELLRIFFQRWRFDSPVWGMVMARREHYVTERYFDDRFGFYADIDMWLKLSTKHDVAYVNEPLIFLASRNAAPRLFLETRLQTQRTLEHMFWNGRMRHFRGRPIRKTAEAIRHIAFAMACRSWSTALAGRRCVRTLLARIGPRLRERGLFE